MQVETQLCKEESIDKPDPHTPPPSEGQSSLRWTEAKTIQCSDMSKFVSTQFKSWHLWWYGDVFVHIAWVTCTYTGFWRNINCQVDNIFFKDSLAYFKTMPDDILHVFQQHGTVVKQSSAKLARLQSWLATLWNIKYSEGDRKLLSSWKPETWSENGKTSHSRFQDYSSLSPQFPDAYRVWLKEWWTECSCKSFMAWFVSTKVGLNNPEEV